MTWSWRTAAAIWLAIAAVCFCGSGRTACAAPAHNSPSPAATNPDSKQTAWSWLKAKAKRALPNGPPAGPSPAKPVAAKAAMVSFHWSFEDIAAAELAEKLRKCGFEFPVSVTGTLSLQLDVGVPWKSPLTSEEYDLDGRLQAARLVVAGIEVRNVSAHLTYDRGLLALDHLKFELPGGKRNGVFSGGAEMQLSPPGELTARLSFEHVEIAEFLRLAPELAEVATGQASGNAAGRVEVSRLGDLSAWRLEGRAAFQELRALGLPPAVISTDLRLAQGVVYATNLTGEAEHTKLAGSGQLGLLKPFSYSAVLRMTAGKLSHLNRLKPELKLPLEVAGRVGAAARLQGALETRQFSLTGGVNARDLRIAGLKLDQLNFTFDANHERLYLHPASGSLYGGRGDLSLAMHFGPDGETRVGLRWSKVRLDAVVQETIDAAIPISSVVSGALRLGAPTAHFNDPAGWRGDVSLSIDHFAFEGWRPAPISVEAQLHDSLLEIAELSATLPAANGQKPATLRASGQIKLAAPYEFKAAMSLADFDLARLNALPEEIRPPAQLAGLLGAVYEAQGTLAPFAASAQGAARGDNLRWEEAQIDRLGFDFALDPNTVSLSSIEAAIDDGLAAGAVVLPLTADAAGAIKLSLKQLDLAKLLAGVVRL
ncbi:MAG TPA: hypothetical protein VN699_07475, partial [Pirellulales bacterium]|nr:hypothetical protein [Pirellulales bacterium]